MPPRTRGARVTKSQKENIVPLANNAHKGNIKESKPTKKVLADRTNSASDHNSSKEEPIKPQKGTDSKPQKANMKTKSQEVRARRDRRLPARYVENKLLKELSNSKEETVSNNAQIISKRDSKTKRVSNSLGATVSPFKTPPRSLDSSIILVRPKRVCRLPSRFEDHSISPSKFIPVQPCHASTPITQKVHKKSPSLSKNDQNILNKKKLKSKRQTSLESYCVTNKTKELVTRNRINSQLDNDTNNNAKQLNLRNESINPESKPTKGPLQNRSKPNESDKKRLKSNVSLRILDDKVRDASSKEKRTDLDVYEFVFDPNEEPAPKKKKRKAVRKKPANPKPITYKTNYDKNLAKAIALLKNTVSQKPGKQGTNQNKAVNTKIVEQPITSANVATHTIVPETKNDLSMNGKAYENKFASIRIEDIAADFEESVNYDNIDYSPVNSPRPDAPQFKSSMANNTRQGNKSTDPLNLFENLSSSFNDQPVASSSINLSARHPEASPWRVEFNNLPIKWHSNTYLKPNMTPALESSFITSEENVKKHVYTNLVCQSNDSLPQIADTEPPQLKQTSILSFIKEVVEKSANKKKKDRSGEKTCKSLLFDTPAVSNIVREHSDNSASTTTSNMSICDIDKNTSNNTEGNAVESETKKELSENVRKRKNKDECKVQLAESTNKKDFTFFGFDDSENIDQENISPKKLKRRLLRSNRPKRILQEPNIQPGPTRVELPIVHKSNFAVHTDVVDNLLEEMKAVNDAPVMTDTIVDGGSKTVYNDQTCQEDNSSPSVHLFEDIEVVHHNKLQRKSYGKVKKVTIRNNSDSGSDTQNNKLMESEDEDNLDDLTFHIPSEKPKRTMKKKITKKQKLNKKEEEEAEAWAAGFNSMCEDVEGFDLVLE